VSRLWFTRRPRSGVSLYLGRRSPLVFNVNPLPFFFSHTSKGYAVQLLNSADDLNWLESVHLKLDLAELRRRGTWRSAVITGNEDSPDSITLYSKAEPLATCSPVAVLTLSDDFSGYAVN
jgi:hypothetical protein